MSQSTEDVISDVTVLGHFDLPDRDQQIANFLHEIRAGSFPSLNLRYLPPLQSDHSRLNVHAILTPRPGATHIEQLRLADYLNAVEAACSVNSQTLG